MNNIIDLMHLQYIYAFIYIKQVSVIQRYYHYYQFKKYFYKLKHSFKMKECLEDIIEVGYLPPTEEYLLLKNAEIISASPSLSISKRVSADNPFIPEIIS